MTELTERELKLIDEGYSFLSSIRKNDKSIKITKPSISFKNQYTYFSNFENFCESVNRTKECVKNFIDSECKIESKLDQNNVLKIKLRLNADDMMRLLKRFLKKYVTCNQCGSRNTILKKRKLFCLVCSSEKYID